MLPLASYPEATCMLREGAEAVQVKEGFRCFRIWRSTSGVGSVADRRKIHAASMLYHIQNGSVPKLAGTSN